MVMDHLIVIHFIQVYPPMSTYHSRITLPHIPTMNHPHWSLAVYIDCDSKIGEGVLQRRLWCVKDIIPLRDFPQPN